MASFCGEIYLERSLDIVRFLKDILFSFSHPEMENSANLILTVSTLAYISKNDK
jgi:hypothetical protein